MSWLWRLRFSPGEGEAAPKDTFAKPISMVVSGALAALVAVTVVLSPLAAGGSGMAFLLSLSVVVELRSGALMDTTDLMLPDIAAAWSLPKAYVANQARVSVLRLVAAPVGGVLVRVWAGFFVVFDADVRGSYRGGAEKGVASPRVSQVVQRIHFRPRQGWACPRTHQSHPQGSCHILSTPSGDAQRGDY